MKRKCSADFILPGAAILSALLFCGLAPAKAGPLDSKTCQDLGAQRDALKKLGIENEMAKGADWARANLSAGDLNLIKQFIELNEQLKFRCTGTEQAAKKGPLGSKPEIGDEQNEAASSSGSPPLPSKRSKTLVAPKEAPASAGNKRPVKRRQQEARDGN